MLKGELRGQLPAANSRLRKKVKYLYGMEAKITEFYVLVRDVWAVNMIVTEVPSGMTREY